MDLSTLRPAVRGAGPAFLGSIVREISMVARSAASRRTERREGAERSRSTFLFIVFASEPPSDFYGRRRAASERAHYGLALRGGRCAPRTHCACQGDRYIYAHSHTSRPTGWTGDGWFLFNKWSFYQLRASQTSGHETSLRISFYKYHWF